LIHAGQKAAAPQRGACAGEGAGDEDDKGGHIAVLAAEAFCGGNSAGAP
jgi:hypothetical protein